MAGQKKPTEQQEKILRYIQRYGEEHNRPPSYREIEAAIGVNSTSVVSYHVGNLIEKALLTREQNVARGLSLTDEALTFLGKVREVVEQVAGVANFRLAGDIGASTPVEFGNGDFVTYDEEETITVDAGLLPKRRDNLFALRVRGDSMIDSLIRHRDIVILERVERVTDVRDGEMVAAWLKLEQELTLKHFYREGDNIRLQPANPTMAPIFAAANNVKVQARVVTVLRPDAGRIFA